MIVNSKITVDLTRTDFAGGINAMQGDGNTRSVEITLLSGGEPWIPPDGVEVAVAYRTPTQQKGLYQRLTDGTPAITISDNVATILLVPQMLAMFGTVQAALVFYDGQRNQLTTIPFHIDVLCNPAWEATETEGYIHVDWLEAKLEEYIAKLPGGVEFQPDASLTLSDGILSVNTADVVEADNTLPVTSAAVHVAVGNIEALLGTI